MAIGTGAAIALGATSIAAPIVGGIVGNIAAGKDRDAANAAAARALARIDAVGAPPDLSKAIIMEEFKNAGIMIPDLEQHIDAGFSQVAQIQEDPKLREAQMSALNILQQQGRTGFGAQDRAALNQVRDEMSRDAEGKRQQIIQNMQARGMGGSGAELAAQLQQAQASANQASMEGDRIAAQASARALEALTQGTQLAGQVRGQDFDVANTKASAADEFQRFNVQNQIARQQRNVDRQNEAKSYNLSNNQRLSDMNTSMRNDERVRQTNAQRQFWQDKYHMASGQAAMDNQEAARHSQNAANTAQMWAGIGSGIGSGAATALTYGLKGGTKSTTTAGKTGSTAATPSAARGDDDLSGEELDERKSLRGF